MHMQGSSTRGTRSHVGSVGQGWGRAKGTAFQLLLSPIDMRSRPRRCLYFRSESLFSIGSIYYIAEGWQVTALEGTIKQAQAQELTVTSNEKKAVYTCQILDRKVRVRLCLCGVGGGGVLTQGAFRQVLAEAWGPQSISPFPQHFN